MLAALCALAIAPQRMLVVDGLLIATCSDGKKWSRPPEVQGIPPIYNGDWTKLTLDGKAAGKTFPAALTLEDEIPYGYWIDTGRYMPGVYYSGPKWKTPKATVIKSQAYKDILLKYVRKQVPGAKLVAFKGLQVDLNGDGRAETLLAGGSRPHDELQGATAGMAKKDDFSIVLLRAVVGGKVKEIPISFTKVGPRQEGDGYYIPNVADLVAVANIDGDPHVEVISTFDFYEGQSARILRWDGRKVIELAENGSGV